VSRWNRTINREWREYLRSVMTCAIPCKELFCIFLNCQYTLDGPCTLVFYMLLISSVHVALISGAQIVAHLSTAFLINSFLIRYWCWEYFVTTCRVPGDAPLGRHKLKLPCPLCSSRPASQFLDWRPQPLPNLMCYTPCCHNLMCWHLQLLIHTLLW